MSDQTTGPTGTDATGTSTSTISATEQDIIAEIERAGAAFHAVLNRLGASREVSLARTKIDEAIMWGTKHLTR